LQHEHGMAVDTWTKLHKSGALTFSPCSLQQLPASTRMFLERFVIPASLTIELGPTIAGILLFRLSDDVVGYLSHCPLCKAHVWARPDFGDLANNEALARLAVLAGTAPPGTEGNVKAIFDGIDRLLDHERGQ
jgi:hypothetical protein